MCCECTWKYFAGLFQLHPSAKKKDWNRWQVTGMSKMEKIATQQILHSKKTVDLMFTNIKRQRIEYTILNVEDRLLPTERNNTHAFFVIKTGGTLQEICCPLRDFEVANVPFCSAELAIRKNNKIMYIRYPEMLLTETAVFRKCSNSNTHPWKCETYKVSNCMIQQCPKNVRVHEKIDTNNGNVNKLNIVMKKLKSWILKSLN